MNTNRAQYNITDDRLKFWPAERLSPEDYDAAKACKFQWFPGQKCFSAIWRPQAEDFLARFVDEIEDVCEIDDVAARVERFDKYAGNAEQSAQSAADRLESGKANTERRQRLAERVAAREFSTAAHWQRRIAGAIAHAQHKENPGAILRRIETLETDLRHHERRQLVKEETGSPGSVWVGGTGRGQGSWMKREDLPAHLDWSKRWVDHITHRLEYERARLAATGHTLAKLASNEIVLEVGGALHLNRRRVKVEGWYLITKLNPSSVEIYSPKEEEWRGPWVKIPRDELSEVASKAQVDSGEITVARPEGKKPSAQPKGTAQTREGKTPEKFGAFGRSSGFSHRLEDVDTWYLITKVNRISVEYITLETYRDGLGEHQRIMSGKTDIHGLRHLRTPAEVKAERPELLAAWEQLQKLEKVRADIKAGRCPKFDDLQPTTRAKFYELASQLAQPVADVFADWFKWSGGDWKKTPGHFLDHLKQSA